MRTRRRLVYFLDRFPDEPVELAPGKICRIGRGSGSDVFVPDVGVSRCHADIRWEGDGFVITDLGSANGTFVNGERILELALVHGDEVRVGPRALGFRVEDASTMGENYERRSRRVRELNTAVNYSPLEGGLAGALADVPLADVVQVLERARKTGRLYVGLEGSHGALSFREGRVAAAEWTDPDGGEIADHEAAYAILALEDGVFEFVPEAVPEETRIDQSAQSLLLESMRRMDERGRADAAAVRGDQGDKTQLL
ncbi:MAG: DUF4388 domain-containing protein [Planctomycetota bacterium]